MESMIHFYRVKSLDRCKVFYGEVLGFELVKDQGKCLIFDALGKGHIGFCTHFPEQDIQQSCITLVFKDQKEVDAMYDLIKKHVVCIDQPSINEVFNIYHFFCKDDQGLTLEVQCFL